MIEIGGGKASGQPIAVNLNHIKAQVRCPTGSSLVGSEDILNMFRGNRITEGLSAESQLGPYLLRVCPPFQAIELPDFYNVILRMKQLGGNFAVILVTDFYGLSERRS